MVRTDTKFVATWIFLVLVQIVICDCMFLGPLVTVTLLPVLVIFLPLYARTETTMLIAFVAGFAVDWLSDGVLGLNMASLVPVALLQKPLVRLFIGEDTVVRTEALSAKKSGTTRLFALSAIATAIFLLLYVALTCGKPSSHSDSATHLLHQKHAGLGLWFLIGKISC